MFGNAEDATLKAVLEGSPIGVAILEKATGKRLFVNSRLVEMFAAGSRDNMLNDDIKDTWVNRDDLAQAFAIFQNGGLLVNFVAERRRFDGSTWWVLMNTQPITFDNKDAGIVWHIDVSEQKNAQAGLHQAKREAEAANMAKTEFLAHMSHELRTPLNSILGFSQVLASPSLAALTEAKKTDYARNIYASGAHLLEIINDILDISKIEAGEFPLDESEFTVEDVLCVADRMVRSMADETGVTITLQPSCGEASLRADKRVVTQIVVNLLSNAIKFNNQNGTVTVSSGPSENGGLSISIADTGIGISPEDIPKALTPFGQVRTNSQNAHDGTGLGLSLSKRLIELHGGGLDLTSEPGKGTQVAIWFPPERTKPAPPVGRV
jgi:signal transduction histidine kinase